MRRKLIRKTIFAILLDLAAAGVLLCGFAFFHHVLQVPGDTTGVIEIPRPSASAAPLPASGAPVEQTQTERTYQSGAISISLNTVQTGSGSSALTYHIADLFISDIEALQTAFADGTYGRNYTESVLEQDLANDAILAISGDSYGMSEGGIVIRNGILYRYEETASDICVLYYDGTMETLSPGEYTQESLIESGACQVWTFGPGLLDKEGRALRSFNTDPYLIQKHPRAAIGYYEPGHYVFVLVDGRQEASQGLTLRGLAELFEALGCTAAYNLDGGKSAVMTFNDEICSEPYTEPREVTDIIYIKEV